MPDAVRPSDINRRIIHKGAKFDFEEVTWPSGGPGGRALTRQVVRHPGAVVIVPVLEDGSVVFIRNFRIATEQRLLELPAGTLEPQEAPEVCAARELVEETGYQAATLRQLGRFYTSPGLSDELMHAFVATGLKEVGQDLEEDEDLTIEIVAANAVLEMLQTGKLVDGKSMLAVLLAWREGLLPGESQAG
jgi:ADP-ribose pyrophosphatase